MVADERISKLHAAALFFGLCFSLPLALTQALTSFRLADRDWVPWVAYWSGTALLLVVGHVAFGEGPSVLGRGAAVLERCLVPCFALTWCWLLVLPAGFAYSALHWPGPSNRSTEAYQAAVAASAIALEYWALRSIRWRMVSSVAIISGVLAYWLCAVPAVVGPLAEFLPGMPGEVIFVPWLGWLTPSSSQAPVHLYAPALALIVARLRPGTAGWPKTRFLIILICVPLACAAYSGSVVSAYASAQARRPVNQGTFGFVLPWQGKVVLPLLLASCIASFRFAWSLTTPFPVWLRVVVIVILIAPQESVPLTFAPILAFTAVLAGARLVSTDMPVTGTRQAIVLAGWIAGSVAMVLLIPTGRSLSGSTWLVLATWTLTLLWTAVVRWRSS